MDSVSLENADWSRCLGILSYIQIIHCVSNFLENVEGAAGQRTSWQLWPCLQPAQQTRGFPPRPALWRIPCLLGGSFNTLNLLSIWLTRALTLPHGGGKGHLKPGSWNFGGKQEPRAQGCRGWGNRGWICVSSGKARPADSDLLLGSWGLFVFTYLLFWLVKLPPFMLPAFCLCTIKINYNELEPL